MLDYDSIKHSQARTPPAGDRLSLSIGKPPQKKETFLIILLLGGQERPKSQRPPFETLHPLIRAIGQISRAADKQAPATFCDLLVSSKPAEPRICL